MEILASAKMSFSTTSLPRKILFSLEILCFVIDITGSWIPYWHFKEFTESPARTKLNGGLWSVCYEYINNKTCDSVNVDYLPDWWRVIRILSWELLLLAVFLHLIFILFVPLKKCLYAIVICLSFVGALCALITFAVYSTNAKDLYSKYSAGFFLTIISFILGLINGIIGAVDYLNREVNQSTNATPKETMNCLALSKAQIK